MSLENCVIVKQQVWTYYRSGTDGLVAYSCNRCFIFTH